MIVFVEHPKVVETIVRLRCNHCGRLIQCCHTCGGFLSRSNTVRYSGGGVPSYIEHQQCGNRLYYCPGCGAGIDSRE